MRVCTMYICVRINILSIDGMGIEWFLKLELRCGFFDIITAIIKVDNCNFHSVRRWHR